MFLVAFVLCGLMTNAQEKILVNALPDGESYQTILLCNPDGTNPDRLFPNDGYNRFNFTISKDKTKIIYVKDSNTGSQCDAGGDRYICISNIDGSDEQIVWTNPNPTYRIFGKMAWSNDLQTVYFEYGYADSDRNSDIYSLDITNSTLTNLTNNGANHKGVCTYVGVAISPDNSKLIYGYSPSGWFAIPLNFYTMNTDGTDNQQFTDNPGLQAVHPTFSSDGNLIMFNHYYGDGGIYTILPDGTNKQRINLSVGENHGYFPTFNTDNSQIVFIRDNKIVYAMTDGTILNEVSITGYTSFGYIYWFDSNSKVISFDNQTTNVGRTIVIPVLTSELTTNDNVIAYQFDFNYDNTKLEYVGNSLVGTLAVDGTLQVNPLTNKLSIAWARGTALVGEGEILKLQFKVLAVGETTPTITNALYNTESVTATNGTITAVYKYGDIDANDFVQAYDAALAIQYSVGLDPLPTIDPLPWENWRVIVADVDGTAGVTANDASEILKYTVGLISTFPVEGGKKSLKSGNADINITLVGNELLFQPTGELYGLNVNVTENISVLGQPQFLNANMLNATNINANTYSIGLATANAPTENETFMKIPITLTQNTNLTFDLIINTTVKSVTVSGTTGIVTINDKAISVYPNPTNSILYVNGMQNANIQIFDLTGKLLINEQNADNQINVSNLQNGIYSIKITNESGTVIRKFVKQ